MYFTTIIPLCKPLKQESGTLTRFVFSGILEVMDNLNQRSPNESAEQSYGSSKTSFHSKTILISIIVFILVLVSLLTLLLGSRSKTTSVPTPTGSVMMENWKTYTNKKNSFSFSYPDTWIFTSSETEQYEPRIDLQHERTLFTIYLSKVNSEFESIPIIRKETIKIDDRLVIFEYYNSTITKQLSGHSDLSLPENTLPFYTINFHLDETNKDSDLSTIKQILSTFKFTDQNQAADTSSWKIYTNTSPAYSFKYPPDWKFEKLPNGIWASLQSSDYEIKEGAYAYQAPIIKGVTIGIPISPEAGAESFLSIKEGSIIGGQDISPPEKVFNFKKLQLDGQEAIQYDHQGTIDNTIKGTTIQVRMKDNKVYNLGIDYASESSKATYLQILSTFKFQDLTSPIISNGECPPLSLPKSCPKGSPNAGISPCEAALIQPLYPYKITASYTNGEVVILWPNTGEDDIAYEVSRRNPNTNTLETLACLRPTTDREKDNFYRDRTVQSGNEYMYGITAISRMGQWVNRSTTTESSKVTIP